MSATKNQIIEALIYIQGEKGLSSGQLQSVISLNKIEEARSLLKTFKEKFNTHEPRRGLRVEEFNDIFKFATIKDIKGEAGALVTIMKKQKLSNAAVEVAGIIAYKQPITKSMINKIRGVSSEMVVNTLLIKGMIEEVGIGQTQGNPVLYGTAAKFYDYFKIKSMSDLPNLSELNDTEILESTEYFDLFDSQRGDE